MEMDCDGSHHHNSGQKVTAVELKHPMQALLVAPDNGMRSRILSGKITGTIREGSRDYRSGPVMLCCHIAPWAVLANISTVRHCTLGDVTEQEIAACGFFPPLSFVEMAADMRKYYPHITEASPVTVIHWDHLEGFLADHANDRRGHWGRAG
ncbi:MAG TPA: hypothetical protein VJH33_04085 [Candidatus Paceibacterota bacterium]